MGDRTRRGRRSTARLVTTAAVVTLVVLGGGVTAYAATRDDGPHYRTATVSTQDVTETLHAVGTVQPGTSTVVSFPVTGTVAAVYVVPGQHVVAGQRLATLDTTSLAYAVAWARQSVAQAELTLYRAENGQTSSGSGSSGTGSTGSSSTGSSSSRPSSSATTKAVAAAQQSVTQAQRALDRALAAARSDLALATSLCTTTQPPAGTTSPAEGPTGNPGGTQAPRPTTCADAQTLVLADETAVAQQQQALANGLATLDRLLRKSAASGGSGSSGSSGSSSGSTSTVSAAQLAADQAAVDAAQAQLAVAEQELAQATIVSPIAGVVSAVGLTVGSTASAGSQTAAVSVIGTSHVVTFGVDVTKVARVAVGQRASVVVDGRVAPVTGSVTSVGVAPTTSGGSTYAVTLGLDGDVSDLRDGTQAAVTVTVAEAKQAVSVPSSAVRHVGTFAVVTVVSGSTTETVRVTVGAVGPVYTAVTQGLSVGQQVVLADLDAAVPSNSTTNRFGRGAAVVGGTGLGGGPVVVPGAGGGFRPGR